jgi:uncharacterized cupredoxin-like copper-binding protein
MAREATRLTLGSVMRIIFGTFVGVVAMIALTTGCGGGDGGGEEGTVEVAMGTPSEYAMTPQPTEISAGTVTFEVKNEGTLVHEMVVIKTDKGAANLGTDGEADESGAVDEVADLPAGESKTLELDLTAGTYALVCNLPGHYEQGMYADFTVK